MSLWGGGKGLHDHKFMGQPPLHLLTMNELLTFVFVALALHAQNGDDHDDDDN